MTRLLQLTLGNPLAGYSASGLRQWISYGKPSSEGPLATTRWSYHRTSTTLTRCPPSVWIGRVPLPQLGGLSTTALALGPPNILRGAVQNCDRGGERGWVRGAEFKAGFRVSLIQGGTKLTLDLSDTKNACLR